MLRKGILLIFFISGFTGLVYEVVWIRLFGLIFGNTTLAISAVLSAYMLGLALGSKIIGRLTDRMTRHIKIYALLEVGIGVTAILILLLQSAVGQIFSFIYFYLQDSTFLFRVIQFIIAFILMLPATLFMGGTFPLLAHVIVKNESDLGCGIGTLYSINTLGAVAGSFVTGFFLIRILGVSQTVYLSALLNFLIALSAFGLYRFSVKSEAVRFNETSPPLVDTTARRVKIVIWVMAISGFASLSYEVLWTRVLVFVLTNSVFAFSVMLTTFLFGIGLGGFFGGKWSDKVKRQMSFLGIVEFAIGLSGFFAGVVLVNLGWIHNNIFSIGPKTSWWDWNGIRFLEAFFVMFVPAFFMGVSFPVAARIAIPQLKKIGSGLGRIYFYNTLGGVVGSFTAGVIFISLIGTHFTLILMVMINIFLGLYLIRIEHKVISKQLLYFLFLPAFLLLFIVTVKILPSKLFTVAYSHVEKGAKLIDYREGIEGTVTVHETLPPFERVRRIDVDGLNVAGSSFMLRTLQILQGQLPFLVKPDAESVVQIGFGTGQTSHSVLLHHIEKFNLAEISKDVLELSDIYFRDLNHGVINNPNFNYRILDGRNYIKYTRNRFDIIMNDANYAVATSSANLFTKEHFENCRRKLTPGGILSTWMTVDLDPGDFAIVLKTFQSVFPYCTLWMAPNCINKQVVLIGSTKPLKIDFLKAQKMFNDPEIKKDLSSVNINSVYDLLSCLILDSAGIKSISEKAMVNSDNHPVLEFSQKGVRSRDMCSYQNIGKIIIRRPDIKSILTNLPDSSDERKKVEEKLNRYWYASDLFFKSILKGYQGQPSEALETLIKGSKTIPESNLAAYFFQETDRLTNEFTLEAQKNPHNLNAQLNLVQHKMGLSRFDEALNDLKRIMARYRENALIDYEMTRYYFNTSNLDSAEFYIRRALDFNSEVAAFWYLLGEIKRRENCPVEALEFLEKSLQIDPRMYQSYNSIAAIYRDKYKYQEAVKSYKASLSIVEYQPGVTADMAYCYLRLGEIPEAINFYKKAIYSGLNNSESFFQMGNAYYLKGDFSKAVKFFQKALFYDSTNAEIFYNLGNAYVMKKQFYEAVKAYKKAIELNIQEPDYFNNLAMTYKILGQIKDAQIVFKNGLKYHPNSEILRRNFEDTKKMQ